MLCEREQWQSCGLCRMLSQYSFIGMQSCVGLMCVEKVKHSVLSMIECSNFTCTSRFLWLVTALTYVVEWNDDYIMIYYIMEKPGVKKDEACQRMEVPGIFHIWISFSNVEITVFRSFLIPQVTPSSGSRGGLHHTWMTHRPDSQG